MESLVEKIKEIEKEYAPFLKGKNIKLSQYIIITKKPVMLNFNTIMDKEHTLPEEIKEKLYALIRSYY